MVFDGDATETQCDMTKDGGGWTQIFSDDFEISASPSWSITTRTTCGTWGNILAGYNVLSGGTLDITLNTYGITHTETWVTLDHGAIDSWDGEEAWIGADGVDLWRATIDNHPASLPEVCGYNGAWMGLGDRLQSVEGTGPHAAATLDLEIGSTLDQPANDESWGIDNVVVWIR